jgi:hypothetical protein
MQRAPSEVAEMLVDGSLEIEAFVTDKILRLGDGGDPFDRSDPTNQRAGSRIGPGFVKTIAPDG